MKKIFRHADVSQKLVDTSVSVRNLGRRMSIIVVATGCGAFQWHMPSVHKHCSPLDMQGQALLALLLVLLQLLSLWGSEAGEEG